MKKIRRYWWAGLLVLPIAVMVLGAQAADVGEGTTANPGGRTGQQIIVVDPNTYVRYLLKGTSGGSLQSIDPSRDRDQLWFYTDAINNSALAEDSQDSTAMLSTLGWNRTAVWIYASVPAGGATTWAALFAMQVRGGPTAANDSIGAHPWSRWKTVTGNAAASLDTVGMFDMLHNVNVLDRVDPETEIPVVCVIRPEHQRTPRGMRVDLRDPRTGDWWSSPYTSIRLRLVETYDYNGAAEAAKTVRVRLDMYGSR